MTFSMNKQKITYSQSGVNYASIDPVKTFAQEASRDTAKHLQASGFEEVETTRQDHFCRFGRCNRAGSVAFYEG